MSSVLEGKFAVHRTQDANGRNAILIIPESRDEVITLDERTISFERVPEGYDHPDSYLTITDADGNKIHFGPNKVLDRIKN